MFIAGSGSLRGVGVEGGLGTRTGLPPWLLLERGTYVLTGVAMSCKQWGNVRVSVAQISILALS